MGGRGGSSNGIAPPNGRRMSLKRFLENLSKNDRQGMINDLSESKLDVGNAIFTENGNAIKMQEAVIESGEDRVSVRFYNSWNPVQVAKPTSPIKQSIEIVHYKNGNATAIRKLDEKSSKSLKNAEKNYNEMLKKWKSITGQKNIYFR